MTSNQEFGGNIVKQLQEADGKKIFNSGSYEYFIYETKENEEIHFHDLRSFSIYIFEKSSKASITIRGLKEKLEQGDCLQSEDCNVYLNVSGGTLTLLVAGTTSPHPTLKGLFLNKSDGIYKVEKPWGYELWLNGQHPCYALKKIFIKAGTKSSLQYHRFKQETIVLFEGIAKLHYKKNESVSNELVTASDIETIVLKPRSTVNISPFTLHRFEAVTNILLFETSTPHLDDIVRIQDDSKRPHGRIIEEYQS